MCCAGFFNQSQTGVKQNLNESECIFFVSLFGASLIDIAREIRLQQETRTRTHITMEIFPSSPDIFISTNSPYFTDLFKHQDNSSLVIISSILMTCMCYSAQI